MKKILAGSALLICACLFATQMHSQGKAKVYIKKSVDGVKSEETREIAIAEGEDIEKILQEVGVLNEFGQLMPGQEFEIKIDKYDQNNNVENLHFYFTPDGNTGILMPPPPPLAPNAPDGLSPLSPMAPMEKRPFLGIMMREGEVDGENMTPIIGAYISEVIEGTAAETAGLLEGDVIVEIDDMNIENMSQVIDYIRSKESGDKVEIQVERNGKKKKVKAVLGEKEMAPEMSFFNGENGFPNNRSPYNFRFDADSITIFCPPNPNCICPDDSMKICQPFTWNGEGLAIRETAFLGVTPSTNFSQEGGVRIDVEPETSAEEMGLLSGDIILEMNGTAITSFDVLSELISAMNPGEEVKIEIQRENKKKTITGNIGKRSISGFEDFRIFHDFKGMDEGGHYLYDYEFDMDAEDVEEHMEELLRTLDEQQFQLDEERARLLEEMDKLRMERETIIIQIRIEDITAEELQAVNETATPKLSTANDLAIDEISFFPNPGNGLINLSFTTQDRSDVKIIVFDSKGNTVYTEDRKEFDGNYKNTIDISTQPNGTYYLQIIQGEKSYSKKIVKGL
ncbi:MAG: PDZ domain-containing protein [Flavobacteriales bacterium]